MAKLDEYSHKFDHVLMERRDGILQMSLHSGGTSQHWPADPLEPG